MAEPNTTPRRARALALLRPAAIVAATLLIGACAGGDPAGGDAAGPAGSTTGLTTRDHPPLGTILTNAAGETLYFAEQETDGTIRCTTGCLQVWKPMPMPPGASADGGIAGLGATQRADSGQSQLTYQGKPLYTFALDAEAGDVRGENAQDDFNGTHFVWHAVVIDAGAPPGGPQPTTEDGGGYGY